MASDLSPDTELFIEHEVANGVFQSREDALEAGIALLRRRRELMDRLAESRRQLDEGEFCEYDDEELGQLFEELIVKAEGKAQRQ